MKVKYQTANANEKNDTLLITGRSAQSITLAGR